MKLTFYFAPMSTASVTEAVLAELGVAHEVVTLDISAGETRGREFLEVNPNGRVPAIVHDGVAIWESAAISLYLGETFGVALNLFPPAGSRRGEAMKWVIWTNVNLAEAGGRLAAALPSGTDGGVQENSVDWVAPEERSPRAIEKARRDLDACLAVLDRALEKVSYLLGEYTLVDTHAWAFVGWLTMMQVDLSRFTNISAWMDRCSARPALARLTGASEAEGARR